MCPPGRYRRARAETRLWHPFSDMALVRRAELVLARGEDVWLWDVEGRRYLDATASLWYANVGHGRREIADAVHAQMLRLWSPTRHSATSRTEPALRAGGAPRRAGAGRRRARLPDDRRRRGDRHRREAGATLLGRAAGQPERVHLIGRTGGYHGTNGYGTSIGGIEPNRAGFGPLMSQASLVAHDSLAALEQEFLRARPRRASRRCSPSRCSAPAASIRRLRATWRASRRSAPSTARCSSSTR